MNKYVYPAMFKKKGDGYFVSFPDIKSCTTGASSLEKAVIIAKDVLEDKINAMIAAGEKLPKASDMDSLGGDRVMLVVVEEWDKPETNKNAEVTADKAAEEAAEQDEKKAESEQNSDEESALAAEKEKYLRLLAEYDNFRKRSFQDKENAASDAVSKAVVEMLSVTDNFNRAISAECSDPNYKKGVEMIYAMFRDCLDRIGVAEIEALGKPFDPNFHEAVSQIQDDNFGENTVCDVFQSGYTLNGKLVRCAMVAVANP